jgi:hypothetical protein
VSTTADWTSTILESANPSEAWRATFDRLLAIAKTTTSPVELHNQTKTPDRLIAESAWELWQAYTDAAPRTSQELIAWWSQSSGAAGKAVLILDALSLRELPAILAAAEARGIQPIKVRATGAEAPSTTDQFAKALGAGTRAGLKNNTPPGGFSLSAGGVHTDVVSYPFQDCLGSVPNEKNVVLWHTWLDDLIHVQKKLPDQIYKTAQTELQGDGFWALVDRLRQGRKLIITSDHGYAVGKLFSTEERDDAVVEALREVFGASRYESDSKAWVHRLMPPIVVTQNGHQIVMGQRKWKVQGGFPHVDHGGLTLLEVAVPFIEISPI